MYVYIWVNTQDSRRHILGHIAVHTVIGSVARELRLQPHDPPKYSLKQMKFGYNRNYSNSAGFSEINSKTYIRIFIYLIPNYYSKYNTYYFRIIILFDSLRKFVRFIHH